MVGWQQWMMTSRLTWTQSFILLHAYDTFCHQLCVHIIIFGCCWLCSYCMLVVLWRMYQIWWGSALSSNFSTLYSFKTQLFSWSSLEICGNLWKWLSAYLLNRHQRVQIGDAISEVLPIILSGITSLGFINLWLWNNWLSCAWQ